MRPSLAIHLPLLFAYAWTFDWIRRTWFFGDAYYSHGWIVVLIGIVLLWTRRDRLAAIPERVDARGWLLLGPGLLLHLVGAALLIDSLSAFSLVFTMPGAVWLAYGPARLRALGSVIGLWALAIPLPLFATGRLAFELKEIAVGYGMAFANLFGLGAERDGAQLLVPGADAPLLVADPCSGLRSLVALVTLGYGLAFFSGSQRGLRRWLIVAAAGPAAVATNVLRIAGICWLARWFDVGFASGTGHDVLNVLAWIADIGILVGIDALWSRLGRRSRREEGQA